MAEHRRLGADFLVGTNQYTELVETLSRAAISVMAWRRNLARPSKPSWPPAIQRYYIEDPLLGSVKS
jgi:hypothetical protein